MDINAIVEKLTSVDTPPVDVEKNFNKPNEQTLKENIIENNIKTITFSEYVDKYGAEFANFNINRIKIKVGEEVNDNIIAFKAPKIKNNDEPDIYIMKNCNIMKVPDIAPFAIKIFKHDLFVITFKIRSDNDECDYYMRSYITKGGMKNILCIDVDGLIVPYNKIRISKKISSFNITKIKLDEAKAILDKKTEVQDIETLIIRYPITRKVFSTLNTNLDIARWLIDKKLPSSIDIVHHLKIDILILQIIFNR